MRDETTGSRVYVWDAPTRLFHWSIVILIFVSWLSADQGYMKIHLWSGLTLLTLANSPVVAWASKIARSATTINPPAGLWPACSGLLPRATSRK